MDECKVRVGDIIFDRNDPLASPRIITKAEIGDAEKDEESDGYS